MNSREKYTLNKIVYDDFNRPSGILLLNKPSGISSHDLVDRVRDKLRTKKVGHAGALDVFSSGLMLILVGKATKLSNEILNWDKAYKARIVFGLFNYTQDTEEEIIKVKDNSIFTKEKIIKVLNSFKGNYSQYVSIYSSVKVNGVKLRKILRDNRYSFNVIEDNDNKVINIFKKEDETLVKTIEIPKRDINIYDINLLDLNVLKGRDLPFKGINKEHEFQYCDIYVKCSKGTYIRQLAEDIGKKLNTYAILSELERCELGVLKSEMVIDLTSL